MTDFKVGDRVQIHRCVLGTITDIIIDPHHQRTWYDVLLDTEFLGTKRVAATAADLTHLYESSVPTYYEPKCECGATKLGHPGHDWFCPLFKK